jgi:hypothetical protein
MSEFYNFEDEVPKGSKVSTVDDCEDCADDCGERHCLIQELPIPHPCPDE